MRLLWNKVTEKKTPNPSRLRGRGVDVSKTLFYFVLTRKSGSYHGKEGRAKKEVEIPHETEKTELSFSQSEFCGRYR